MQWTNEWFFQLSYPDIAKFLCNRSIVKYEGFPENLDPLQSSVMEHMV